MLDEGFEIFAEVGGRVCAQGTPKTRTPPSKAVVIVVVVRGGVGFGVTQQTSLLITLCPPPPPPDRLEIHVLAFSCSQRQGTIFRGILHVQLRETLNLELYKTSS